MSVLFTSNFFVENRRRLRESLAKPMPIVVTANGLLQRGADSSFPFVQDANFWYLTGIDEPDVSLVMDGERELLIVPAREGSRETFDGSVDVPALIARSGITTIVDETAGWKRLDSMLERQPHLGTPLPSTGYIEQYGLYANPARARFIDRLQKHQPEVATVDIRLELARLRMIKQPLELQALQQAIDITCASLSDVLQNKRSYTFEYQMEADIARGFRFRGASGHSFEPIVAGGKRACTLHNVANNSALIKNELVVMDVGAEFEHYAADITRTVALQKPTARQQAVYDAVLDVQTYAASLLQPGTKLKKYEQQVERYMGGKLKELGLIKNLSHQAIRQYFPHATSHFLGLNVHDVGDYQQPLQPGVVLTVEPGIYIPEEGIGIRIEDDALITDTGCQFLSAALPRQLF